jgi:hypothetical protein
LDQQIHYRQKEHLSMTYTDTFTAERRPGAFRAILINPWDRTIEEGWQSPGLRSIYATLSGPGFPTADEFPTDPAEWTGEFADRELASCDCIGITGIGADRYGKPVDLITDDEGRLKGNQACFALGDGLLIAGRALIASHDDEGETVSTGLELHDAKRPIRFLAFGADYTSPPMTFTASEPGESLEELQARSATAHAAAMRPDVETIRRHAIA